jgi:GntR family transcriptional regulator of abcA and norABC
MGDLWFDERPPKPIKSLDETGSVIYIGSCSKSFSPGLRIGWVVGPESVIQRLADIKMQQDYGTSTLPQEIFAHCLRTGVYEEHLTKMRRELKRRRDLALKILQEHFADIARWNTPSGSYYIWLQLKGNVSIRRIFEAALAEKILINPGEMYDIRENYSLRFSYVYEDDEVLERSLIRLSEIIKSVMKAT